MLLLWRRERFQSQTKRRCTTKTRGMGRKCSQLAPAPLFAFNILVPNVMCRVNDVGSLLSFPAQPDSTGSAVAFTTSHGYNPHNYANARSCTQSPVRRAEAPLRPRPILDVRVFTRFGLEKLVQGTYQSMYFTHEDVALNHISIFRQKVPAPTMVKINLPPPRSCTKSMSIVDRLLQYSRRGQDNVFLPTKLSITMYHRRVLRSFTTASPKLSPQEQTQVLLRRSQLDQLDPKYPGKGALDKLEGRLYQPGMPGTTYMVRLQKRLKFCVGASYTGFSLDRKLNIGTRKYYTETWFKGHTGARKTKDWGGHRLV